ncbi:MAG: SctK family type III secretion system sorting platform protein [Kiritimatiellae bacterium]|nr:SctK family type III secretion system sorting platform protein [Kiritimatiellia bacterium]
MISIDEARALVANQALWPRVRDFLWDFAPQIHESWLEGLCGHETLDARREDSSSIVSSLSSSWRIKKSILDSLHIEPCFHTFPKDDGSRILLLDGATIESIAKWLGALAYADALRRVTSGATVRELKAALPGVYPEVFGYTEYFRKWKVENGECKIDRDFGTQICRIGCRILLSTLSSLPAPMLRRLELKLPKDWQDSGSIQNFPFSIFNSQFVSKLLKLRYKEAHSLCCL